MSQVDPPKSPLKKGTLTVLKRIGLNFTAAIAFYTCLPVPKVKLDFQNVARFVPLVGLIIGGILGLLDLGLFLLGLPVLTRSAVVVVSWIAITGGLHLDGAMDTADGLAVQDPQKRLQVMADSVTGAFGAMAAIAILLLKISALTELDTYRPLILMAACGWGRWGQQMAIACYPYLKPTGKGAFHKAAIRPYGDILPGLLLLLSVSGLEILLNRDRIVVAIIMALGGSAISIVTGAWLNYKLGGHTGDTYGAVVEWTEALFLCLLTAF